ncbi:MAG: Asp-tRNA(Asn)/Glu-tRNA(Gln) amidotransferase subunit GatB [Gemmatimonadota bacterium]
MRAVDSAGFELVVGLEVHVQLLTLTKLFCPCRARFGDAPNDNTCPICLGMPGALPSLNQHAVELAVRAALALGATLHPRSVFARKNSFYPDLPKGYQISQFDRPLAVGGQVDSTIDDAAGSIRLTRIHIEEDAGKLIHDRYPGRSAVDLNRAGTPLIEIVSEPDIRSPAEARRYLENLREILVYSRVSDANMEEGSLRVDANISIRRVGATTLGTRTEIKNLNSFSGVERAIRLEFDRQASVVSEGGEIIQQTLLFDAGSGSLRPMRSKEESHDYRYFPDPDIPPLVIQDELIEAQKRLIPELPARRRARFRETLGLNPGEAQALTGNAALADYFEAVVEAGAEPRAAASWVTGDVLALLNDRKLAIGDLSLRPDRLAELIRMISSNRISRTAGRRIFAVIAASTDGAEDVAVREQLLQVSDDAALDSWVEAICRENPSEVERLRSGETKLLGVLVGLVMKRSAGKADPRRVNELLRARTRDS